MFSRGGWRIWQRASTSSAKSNPPRPSFLHRYYQSPYFPIYRDIITVLGWLPVAFYVTEHVVSLTRITGESMTPTFNPDYNKDPLHSDIVVMDKRTGKYRRGDVVTLWSSTNPDLLTAKRIVALEGDIVTPLPPMPPKPLRIPPGHCWVEGDSLYRTRDSNTYGPVTLALVNSRVTHVIYPFDRSGAIERTQGKSEGRVKRLGPEWVEA